MKVETKTGIEVEIKSKKSAISPNIETTADYMHPYFNYKVRNEIHRSI